jgi:cation diffusion facilitator CzcD-associated flavoprotein CzcO
VHLQRHCPGKSYLILEARSAMGGTWDLFRYPGIRSDSDMHTLGYNFKPWTAAKAIADGPSILSYVQETAREHDITPHIRFGHQLLAANWSDESACWTLTVSTAQGEQVLTCRMLLMCSGYYSYGDAYTPEFDGRAQFKGPVVHPQHWPDDLDYRDKKVAIIGSGATAMTLAPSMAEAAAQVTVVQRSPTYVVSRPDRDAIANTLRKFLPESWAYAITRWKNVALSQFVYRRSRKQPEKLKQQLLGMVRKELGDDYDVEKHFTPRYNPWDQRLCLVPNADLFKSIRAGKTVMVTDQIKGFNAQGIELLSGEQVQADIIVTATGLTLQVLGGAQFSKNGQPLDFANTWSYKGLMFSGVPNMVFTFGYINASWTLRADLIAEFFCRLVNEIDKGNKRVCTPELRLSDRDMPARPFIDDFSAGYMQRMMHRFPKQGDRAPWLNTQNYASDRKMLRHDSLHDGVLQFS